MFNDVLFGVMSFCNFSYLPCILVGDRILALIKPVPGHCLPFYFCLPTAFTIASPKIKYKC